MPFSAFTLTRWRTFDDRYRAHSGHEACLLAALFRKAMSAFLARVGISSGPLSGLGILAKEPYTTTTELFGQHAAALQRGPDLDLGEPRQIIFVPVIF